MASALDASNRSAIFLPASVPAMPPSCRTRFRDDGGVSHSAADRWREELAAWQIPPEILARAPEPPWGFPVEMFRAPPGQVAGDTSSTPSRERALEALPTGGSVLDVGCGGGAAGLALVPPASLVIGVDDGDGMLASFSAAADGRG